MSQASGARVTLSKEGETPDTLADKILTISGLEAQKERACEEVVRTLRRMQGVSDQEPGVFVIIVPQVSGPVVVGKQGAQIRGIMEESGAELNVGREAIIGMPDAPISINGTCSQVVTAVSRVNYVLQSLADRGKLMEKDFVFRAAPSVDQGADFARPLPGCRDGSTASGPLGASMGDTAPAIAHDASPPSAMAPRSQPSNLPGPSVPAAAVANGHASGGYHAEQLPAQPASTANTNDSRGMGAAGCGCTGGTAAGTAQMGATGGGATGTGMGMNAPTSVGMGMNGMGGTMNSMGSEGAFMSAPLASGSNSVQMTMLLPQALVQNVLVPHGHMAEVAQRAGAQIDLGNEDPPGMRQVTLSGAMMTNSLAAMFLQEKLVQFQQMA